MQQLSNRTRRPTVLFVSDQWGYGTATMGRVIADELKGDVVRLFAGDGPGFELARRASFDRCLRVDSMAQPVAEELERALCGCRAVVSVMNEPVMRLAVRRGIPCVYVDSLLWMWSSPPEIPASVPYFQEDFPGSRDRLRRWRARLRGARIVGPLVARPVGRSEPSPDVLVNFGGLSSRMVEQGSLVAYADVMTRCVLRALEGRPGRVVVAAGRHVLDRMDAAIRTIRPSTVLEDLGHDAYLDLLGRSRALFSSPGMHAIYEACAWDVPCVFLPSQNLSQALASRILERAGVARPTDWGHLYGLEELDAGDEPAACRRIAEQVRRFCGDAGAQAALVDYLRASLEDDALEAARGRQAELWRRLDAGEPGASCIANRVRELAGVGAGRVAAP